MAAPFQTSRLAPSASELGCRLPIGDSRAWVLFCFAFLPPRDEETSLCRFRLYRGGTLKTKKRHCLVRSREEGHASGITSRASLRGHDSSAGEGQGGEARRLVGLPCVNVRESSSACSYEFGCSCDGARRSAEHGEFSRCPP